MCNYINKIDLTSFLHLQDIHISIDDPNSPHLFLTGKNGSGKSLLLNVICRKLEKSSGKRLCDDMSHHIIFRQNRPNNISITTLDNNKKSVSSYVTIHRILSSISLTDECKAAISSKDFILKMYGADRMPKMKEPPYPQKPNFNKEFDLTSEFLCFLLDLKTQESSARSNGNLELYKKIELWFAGFEALLQTIYDDPTLKLEFKEQFYGFFINSEGKSFKFNQLSDGYAAILEIAIDIILTIQRDGSLVRVYDRKGIVLIDEVETHLHIALQKSIMPMLTCIFPNIQFIVTTHSPFVLSSLSNAIAYDMEHKEPIHELSRYSFEALAEGYFGIKTSSSYLEMRLNQLHQLLEKSELSVPDKVEIRRLLKDLNKVSEAVSPLIVGRFNKLRLDYADIIKSIMV